MAKEKTTKENIATLMAENKNQTDKIDRLINTMDNHEESSKLFRRQVVKNTTCINGIKKESLPIMRKLIYGLYGLVGSGIVALFWVLIADFIKNR